jgi:hypothetical protein
MCLTYNTLCCISSCYVQVLLCSGQDRSLPAPHSVRSVSQVAAFLRFLHAANDFILLKLTTYVTFMSTGICRIRGQNNFFYFPEFFFFQFFVNVSGSTLKYVWPVC